MPKNKEKDKSKSDNKSEQIKNESFRKRLVQVAKVIVKKPFV